MNSLKIGPQKFPPRTTNEAKQIAWFACASSAEHFAVDCGTPRAMRQEIEPAQDLRFKNYLTSFQSEKLSFWCFECNCFISPYRRFGEILLPLLKIFSGTWPICMCSSSRSSYRYSVNRRSQSFTATSLWAWIELNWWLKTFAAEW